MLWIDIETRSQCDLIFHGLLRYAQDPTTEVICMSWAFDEEDVVVWWASEPFPHRITQYIKDGGLITAQNSQFEAHLFDYVIGNDYDLPEIKREQWRCSMTTLLANGYPAGLDAGSKAVGIKYQKQADGRRLIKEYCAPNFLTAWKPGDWELMGSYCAYDTEVMREMVKTLRDLTDAEWAEFHLNAKINERGIPVDVELCEAVLNYAGELAADASRVLTEMTDGAMTKHTQRKERDAWLFPRLEPHHMKLLEVYKKGEKKISLDQDHRDYLLECEDLNWEARELLEAINSAGSSALMKFGVAAHTHVAGRVHNTFQFHGAQTGRFAGRGLQPHNFRRDAYGAEEAEQIIDDIKGDYEVDNPSTTMARLLRSMITSEQGIYYVDYAAIEGRVAPWIAGTQDGERKLDLYRQQKDVYVVTAASMFGVAEADVGKDLRQSGKIAELSLQFGGGAGALIGMAKNYGVTFDQDTAKEIVNRWRAANKWAGEIWADFDRAIALAVRTPNTVAEAGRCKFQSDGLNFLWCLLPSGKFLAYPKPKWEAYVTPWDEERVGPTFQSSTKPAAGEPALRKHARGALLFQNAVQGTAAAVLREAVVRADAAGLKIIGHVHDEIMGEGGHTDGEMLDKIMREQPAWAEGLPIDTGGVSYGKRYGK